MTITILPSTIAIESYTYVDNPSILTTIDSYFKYQYKNLLQSDCKLLVYDVLDSKQHIPEYTFVVMSTLHESDKKSNLQCLKLVSNKVLTFQLALYFSSSGTDVYSLTGRHTSNKRTIARKNLLSGLVSAKYNYSIETARAKVLEVFAKETVNSLAKALDQDTIQQNKILTYNWLTKLLG